MPECKNIEPSFGSDSQTYEIYSDLLASGVKKETFDNGTLFYERVEGVSDYKEVTIGKGDCLITAGEVWDKALNGNYCHIFKKRSYLMPSSCLFNDLDPETKFDELLTEQTNDAVSAIDKELRSKGLKRKMPAYEKMLRLGLYYFTYVPDAGWMNWKKNSAPDELKVMLGGLDSAGIPGFRTYLEERGGLDLSRINDDYKERSPLNALQEWRAKCTDVADIFNIVFRLGAVRSAYIWTDGNSAVKATSESEFMSTSPFITTRNHVFLAAGEGKDAQFYDLRIDQPSPDTYKGKDFNWYPLTDREYYAFRNLNMLWQDGSHGMIEKKCALAQEMELGRPAKVQYLLTCSDSLLSTGYTNEANLLEAEKNATEVIQIEPNNYSAYFNLGRARAYLNKHAEAIQSFKEAIRFNKYFLPPYSMCSEALLSIGQKDEALQVMLEGINVANESGQKPDSLFLAKVYIYKEDYDKASEALDEAYKNGERRYLLYLFRGIVARSKGDFDSAKREAQIAAALVGKGDLFALGSLYSYYLEQKQDAEAFIVLHALFSADRSNEKTAELLCNEYLLRKEWQKARETIEAFWDANGISLIWENTAGKTPGWPSRRLPSFKAKDGQKPQVMPTTILLYACAISYEERKEDAKILVSSLNNFFYQAGGVEEIEIAVEFIEEFLGKVPKEAVDELFVSNMIVPVYYSYLFKLSTMKDHAKAIQVGQKLLSHAPDNWPARLVMIADYVELKDMDKAREYFDYVAAVLKNGIYDEQRKKWYIGDLDRLGGSALAVERQDEYIELIEDVEKLHGEKLTAVSKWHYFKAKAYMAAEKWEEAAEALKNVAEDGDDNAELASLYYKAGRFKEAAETAEIAARKWIEDRNFYSLKLASEWLKALWKADEDLQPAIDYFEFFSTVEIDASDTIKELLFGMDEITKDLPKKLLKKEDVRKVFYDIYTQLGRAAVNNGLTEEALGAGAKAREFKKRP